MEIEALPVGSPVAGDGADGPPFCVPDDTDSSLPSRGPQTSDLGPRTSPTFTLYLVTDRRLFDTSDGLVSAVAAVAASLPPGTVGVEVREKDLCARDLLELVVRMRDAVAGTGTRVLVNDRLDIALAAGVDGVHLPATGLPAAAARAAGASWVAVSTHSCAELAALAPADVDFATFGPVFDTASKRGFGPPQGVDALRAATAATTVPIYAIGGITGQTASSLEGTGIAGVAVIQAVLAAPDPAAAAAQIIRRARPDRGRR